MFLFNKLGKQRDMKVKSQSWSVEKLGFDSNRSGSRDPPSNPMTVCSKVISPRYTGCGIPCSMDSFDTTHNLYVISRGNRFGRLAPR